MATFFSYFCLPEETATPLVHSLMHYRREFKGEHRFCYPVWVMDYNVDAGIFIGAGEGAAVWRKPGTVHLYRPGVTFRERCGSPEELEGFSILFSGGEALHVDSLLNPAGMAAFADPERIFLAALKQWTRETAEAGFFAAQAGLFRIARLLQAAVPEKDGRFQLVSGCCGAPASDEFWLDEARRLIQCQLSAPFRISSLAAKLACSASGFSHRFRKLAGESPGAFAMRCRLEKAELLLTSGYPLKEIAARLGFCDEFHFSKTFRRFRGYPPSAGRNLNFE